MATGPANGSTRWPAPLTSRGFAANFSSCLARLHRPERLALGEKVPGDAHDHGREPARVAAKVDDDAVGGAEPVDGLLEERVDARHPDVEPNHSGGRAVRRPALLALDANVHRRQIADRRGLSGLRRGVRPRRRRPACRRRTSATRATLAVRAASSRPSARFPPVAAWQASPRAAATGARRPASRRARGASSRDGHRRRSHRRADRRGSRAVLSRRGERRNPGRRSISTGVAPGLSRPDGMRAKCDSPSRPSISRITSRSSPSLCARAARGPSSALTAGQSRPFIERSKCESRMMVQAASNVSVAFDACAAGTATSAPAIPIAPSSVRTRDRG